MRRAALSARRRREPELRQLQPGSAGPQLRSQHRPVVRVDAMLRRRRLLTASNTGVRLERHASLLGQLSVGATVPRTDLPARGFRHAALRQLQPGHADADLQHRHSGVDELVGLQRRWRVLTACDAALRRGRRAGVHGYVYMGSLRRLLRTHHSALRALRHADPHMLRRSVVPLERVQYSRTARWCCRRL